jgi:hypothetical protein
VHTAPPAHFVLHHTLIGKGAMKKFGINCQLWSETFLIIICYFLIGKAGMNELRKDGLLLAASKRKEKLSRL